MKTALLLIPATNGSVDRQGYLTDCIQEVLKEGFMPFCPDIYEQFTMISSDEYIRRILSIAETIFLFIDFGIDEKMFKVIDENEKEKLVYKRQIPVDLSKYINSLPKILKDVSNRTKIPMEDLQRRTKKREIADARFIYFRRARECTKSSLSLIGSFVGKDHATVLHGIKEARNTRQVVELYEQCYGKQDGK